MSRNCLQTFISDVIQKDQKQHKRVFYVEPARKKHGGAPRWVALEEHPDDEGWMITEHWCVRSLKPTVAENRSPRSKVRSLEQELRSFVGCLLRMHKEYVQPQSCKYKQSRMTSLDVMLSSMATLELLLWQWISLAGVISIYQLSWYLYKWICWRNCKSWARKLSKASVYITGRRYFLTRCLGHKVILSCPLYVIMLQLW